MLEKLLPRLAPSREVRNFALLLLERGRISALPAIARAYQELVDEQPGAGAGDGDLGPAARPATAAAVQRALEQRTGKKVVITSNVDPTLIGGVVARVGDLVFDGSLRTQLEALRDPHSQLN